MSQIMRPDPDEMKSNPRASMIRVEPRKAGGYEGQRRHDLRLGAQPVYVNRAPAEPNIVVIEPPRPGVLRAICRERRARRETQRAMRSDSAVAFIGIITFGAEAQKIFAKLTREQQVAAYREAAKACAVRLHTSLEGLTIHLDESSDHAHLVFPAYDLDGWPLNKTVKRGALHDLQTIMFEVMSRHAPGIERGRNKYDRLAAGEDYANTIHKTVAELHGSLEADRRAKAAEVERLAERIAELRSEVGDAQSALADAKARREKNERLAAKARADLRAARTDERATRKIGKRLASYEARAADAKADAEAAEARLTSLHSQVGQAEGRASAAEADRLSAEANADAARTAARTAEERQAVAEAEAERAERAAAAAKREAIEVAQNRIRAEEAADDALARKASAEKEAAEAAARRVQAETDAARAAADTRRLHAEVERLLAQARTDQEAAHQAKAEVELRASALQAVVHALADGSLRQGEGGKLTMPDPSAIMAAPGMWDWIFPVVRQVIGLRRDAARDRQAAADELAATGADREAAQADRKLARFLLKRVRNWIWRPDLPRQAREEGVALLTEVGFLKPSVSRAGGMGVVSSPSQHVESASEPPSGLLPDDDSPRPW